MLQVATQKNNLKEGFCFKSVNSEVISNDKIVQEMKNFNSTLTDIDADASIKMIGELFKRHLSKGEKIVFPFGSFRAVATGTCATSEDTFHPGFGDNKISIIFEINSAYQKEIQSNMEYKIVPYIPASNPNILDMIVNDDNGLRSDDLTVKAGKPVTLKGLHLFLDPSDEKQGVFLIGTDQNFRVTSYFQRLKETVVFFVPDTLPAGEYKVKIITKPRKDTYTEFSYPAPLKVIE